VRREIGEVHGCLFRAWKTGAKWLWEILIWGEKVGSGVLKGKSFK
jgi:hypothetical protein